jgi:Na+/phosphate symporter
MSELTNAQLTNKVEEIIDAVNDLIVVLNNLTAKTTTEQLNVLNQNDHTRIENLITELDDSQTLTRAKINAIIQRLNQIGTRVGIGPSLDELT